MGADLLNITVTLWHTGKENPPCPRSLAAMRPYFKQAQKQAERLAPRHWQIAILLWRHRDSLNRGLCRKRRVALLMKMEGRHKDSNLPGTLVDIYIKVTHHHIAGLDLGGCSFVWWSLTYTTIIPNAVLRKHHWKLSLRPLLPRSKLGKDHQGQHCRLVPRGSSKNEDKECSQRQVSCAQVSAFPIFMGAFQSSSCLLGRSLSRLLGYVRNVNFLSKY